MSTSQDHKRELSVFHRFLRSESSAGLLLIAVAGLAILVANSPWAQTYFDLLHHHLGPLSVQHWINDGLMALFFLLVGLEIKREMISGQLATWSRRILPGAAAIGGMIAPAGIYIVMNWTRPLVLNGWAISAATDIAFALGVLSLLGSRIPVALKIFLTALAIIDDLGAVLIIALFYSGALHPMALGGAALTVMILFGLNRLKISALWPYLCLGALLWGLVLVSGVHATVAGVVLAFTIPHTPKKPENQNPTTGSALVRLERRLHLPVAFLVIPLFGFANAGLSFSGLTSAHFTDPITLGVSLGLAAGKFVGVLGAAILFVKLGWAKLPHGMTWRHTIGGALLCGIGFTMSLFVASLAFSDPVSQDSAKLGVLMASSVCGVAGYLALATTKPHRSA